MAPTLALAAPELVGLELAGLERGGASAYLLVVLAAATPVLEVLLVVPAGIAAGLDPVAVTVLAALGNLVTVMLVVLAGDRVATLVRRRGRAAGSDGEDGRSRSGRSARVTRILTRYGVPGLGLVAPLLTGTHLAAAAALALGAPRRAVAVWMAVGVVVWAVLAAVAAVTGLGLLGVR